MKSINWNQMSELGLIVRINKEILHPLGLAISREPKTGISAEVLVAGDGEWCYAPDVDTTQLSDSIVRQRLLAMLGGSLT